MSRQKDYNVPFNTDRMQTFEDCLLIGCAFSVLLIAVIIMLGMLIL